MVFFTVLVPGFSFFSFVFKYDFVCFDLIMSTPSEDFFWFSNLICAASLFLCSDSINDSMSTTIF